MAAFGGTDADPYLRAGLLRSRGFDLQLLPQPAERDGGGSPFDESRGGDGRSSVGEGGDSGYGGMREGGSSCAFRIDFQRAGCFSRWFERLIVRRRLSIDYTCDHAGSRWTTIPLTQLAINRTFLLQWRNGREGGGGFGEGQRLATTTPYEYAEGCRCGDKQHQGARLGDGNHVRPSNANIASRR